MEKEMIQHNEINNLPTLTIEMSETIYDYTKRNVTISATGMNIQEAVQGFEFLMQRYKLLEGEAHEKK